MLSRTMKCSDNPCRTSKRKTWAVFGAISLAVLSLGAFLIHHGEFAQVFASGPTNPLPIETAYSAQDFVDSIGVQTHINYIDTPYAQWPAVLAKLKALGIHHIRDGLSMDGKFAQNHRDLNAAGIKCTCGYAVDPNLTGERIAERARQQQDVEALEAANECDAGTNCGGGGKVGVRNVVGSLSVIADAGRQLRVPVLAPSFTTREGYVAAGDLSRLASAGNVHIYFGGRNPGTLGWGAGDDAGNRYGSIAWWLDQAGLDTGKEPIHVTETGYISTPEPLEAGSVPEDIQTAYILRTLFLTWTHGVPRTFIYELLDEFPRTGYGLLRHDLTEKPAFTALKNLMGTLQGGPHDKLVRNIRLSVDGGADVRHVLFQTAEGQYSLVLWVERSDFNAETLKRSELPPEVVSVRLDTKSKFHKETQFMKDGILKDISLDMQPGSSQNTRLLLTGFPTIVEIQQN